MAEREKVWEDITYFSDGIEIAAHLYTPKDWKPGDPARPTIVCLHGYSGMKEVYGMDVPRRFWEEEAPAPRPPPRRPWRGSCPRRS